MESSTQIYKKAQANGVHFDCSCVGVTIDKWESLMAGAKKANKKLVTKFAVDAGVIDPQDAKFRNPYTQLKTKTHLIFVHSAIEYFLKIND